MKRDKYQIAVIDVCHCERLCSCDVDLFEKMLLESINTLMHVKCEREWKVRFNVITPDLGIAPKASSR